VHKPYPRIYALLARHAGFDSALLVRGVEGGVVPSLRQTGVCFSYRNQHEDYPLSYGCLHGDAIKCSLHGSRFCLRTGAPLDAPADTPVATFAVALADGQVWLDPSRRTN